VHQSKDKHILLLNGRMKAPLDASYVVERSIDQLVKILFLAFILALFLTRMLLSHASVQESLFCVVQENDKNKRHRIS
jgi:hypothetical protein